MGFFYFIVNVGEQTFKQLITQTQLLSGWRSRPGVIEGPDSLGKETVAGIRHRTERRQFVISGCQRVAAETSKEEDGLTFCSIGS